MYSIKSLYTPALAEGEGVGTAYEYFAKRLVLRPWLKRLPSVKRMLIAGLPEKYGSSLDFLLLAEELGATAVVADDRPEAIEKLQKSLAAAQSQNWLTGCQPETRIVADMGALAEVDAPFDLVISSEVLQRLTEAERQGYVARALDLGTAVALFCPNAANPAHTNLSGLSGLHLNELQALVTPSPHHLVTLSGYIDMPPFPPGIVRDEDQRAQASSGQMEAFAMWGLGYYARLEKVIPASVRRRQSHIVYILAYEAK
ncbi:MAG TPA: class I SAM-dependent methyltransferase [Anaerolineae bacterium]|nr:class I SAM-dependent methyltransferase [Anaerolineae bacterium]HIP70898.1 class I SAM-dependent methyltransferase [Anaerolineae bacterium]